MKHLDIQTLATGSSGNAYRISDGSSALLIEAGLPIKKLQAATGFSLSSLAGVLITHEHGDHARAAKDLISAGIPTYMSKGTAAAIEAEGYRLLTPLKAQQIGSFHVMPFPVQHDALEPVGFLIISNRTEAKLLYITDTASVDYRFTGVTHLMIECNFIAEILDEQKGEGIEFQRRRLYRNHMELRTAVRFAKTLDKKTLQEIHLLHLSERNADEELMKKEMQKATGAAVYVAQQKGN